ncbi:MAG: Ppx/GppA phosphatase family protein [Azospirillaceae bacterium]
MSQQAASDSRPVEDGEALRVLELDPEHRRRADGRPYAVIDIGSNSVRLLVYNTLGRAPFPRFNEKSLCGLGEGLDRTGRLDEGAMARTVHAVHRFSAITAAMDVACTDILATEAVRRAENGAELTEAIERETGLPVRVLAGEEEAAFSALGVISGFYRPRGLVGDIGGGSLEVAEVLDDRVGDRTVSLPLGALPVRALMAEKGEAAKKAIDEVLATSLPPLLTHPTFYVVGGGWRALARVHAEANGAPLHVAHGYEVETKSLRQLAKQVWKTPANKVARLPGVPARRADTLPAAALVMDRVLKSLKPERVVFSALGLREGWLYSQLSLEEQYLDPLVEGARAFGRPRSRVAAFGPALARWTESLFPGETAEEKRLRLAACALSDIAWADHAEVKARQSFHRLLSFPFIGLDHAERVFLAATIHARYNGKPDDPALEPAITLLSEAGRRRARILGRALLLGYRYSGSVPDILDTARLEILSDRVRLEVSDTESVPDSDAVQSRLKQLAKAVGVHRTELVKAS